MINSKFTEIYNGVDMLIQDLLIPLRTSKTVNKDAFEKLYKLLDDLEILVSKEENIPVKLVGKLFFIYMSMNGEADHVRYPDPVFMEIGKMESYLDKIFRAK